MRIALLLIASSLCLASCASLDVNQLSRDLAGPINPDADGIIYYMPRPYLLVMHLPADTAPAGSTAQSPTLAEAETAASQTSGDLEGAMIDLKRAMAWEAAAAQHGTTDQKREAAAKTHRARLAVEHAELAHAVANGQADFAEQSQLAAQAGHGGNAGAPGGATGGQPQAASPASPGAQDTDFAAVSATYYAKIVYLPDLSRPMRMKMSTFFSSQTVQPTLQDGWMLTSLNNQSDSTALLTAVASAVGAGKSTGAGGGGGGSQGGNMKAQLSENLADVLAGLGASGATPRDQQILKAGLYCFDYSDDTGALVDIEPVVFFTETGAVIAKITTDTPKVGCQDSLWNKNNYSKTSTVAGDIEDGVIGSSGRNQ